MEDIYLTSWFQSVNKIRSDKIIKHNLQSHKIHTLEMEQLKEKLTELNTLMECAKQVEIANLLPETEEAYNFLKQSVEEMEKRGLSEEEIIAYMRKVEVLKLADNLISSFDRNPFKVDE